MKSRSVRALLDERKFRTVRRCVYPAVCDAFAQVAGEPELPVLPQPGHARRDSNLGALDLVLSIMYRRGDRPTVNGRGRLRRGNRILTSPSFSFIREDAMMIQTTWYSCRTGRSQQGMEPKTPWKVYYGREVD